MLQAGGKRMILDVLDGEAAQPRRQWIFPVIVGNTKRPLKIHPANSLRVNFGKPKDKFVVIQLEHDQISCRRHHCPSLTSRTTRRIA